jgi:hypothetical protein
LLQQECHLVATLLAQGLTSLRASGAHNKGALYSASFQLCVGVERMVKLLIVVDYMASNELRPPSAKELRAYQHDLPRLFETARAISAPVDGDPVAAALASDLNHEVVNILGLFGRGDIRYFNLEALASTSSQDDPLARWSSLFALIIEHDVPERSKARARALSAAMGPTIDSIGVVIKSDLVGSPLSATTMITRRVLDEEAARYSTFRVLQILDSLKVVLEVRCDACMALPQDSPAVPYVSEFFGFITADKRFALKAKRWVATG